MTNSEYIKDGIQMIKTEWFPNHVAMIQRYNAVLGHAEDRFLCPRITALQWANPDTSTYLVMYFLHRSTLFVTGDIGHAIYRWSSVPDLEWIAKCDYSYFAEKLEGVDRNEQAKRWDSHICADRVKHWLQHHPPRKKMPYGWEGSTASQEEWHRFLWDNPKIFGQMDFESEAFSFGIVPNTRVIGHWLGLRLALGVEKAAAPAPALAT